MDLLNNVLKVFVRRPRKLSSNDKHNTQYYLRSYL